MRPMTMLNILRNVMTDILPDLLRDGEPWNSLDINYERPHVKRLWRQYGNHRVLLHKIEPCGRDEAFWHPHKSPSAVLVLNDQDTEVLYEMGTGYGAWHGPGSSKPPVSMSMIVSGHAEFAYEMVDPLSWHYVRPINDPSYSLMIIGRPWVVSLPVDKVPPLKPLDEATKEALLDTFRRLVPAKVG